ncbi:MAG: P-type conjugative transfer ATPase TrbB [Pseudomonadota bacterium]
MPTPDEIAKTRLHSLLRSHAGPTLMAALEDPATCEVMLNADGKLWQEKLGERMHVVGRIERSDAQAICDIVASSLGTTITAENPQLDGEWPLDGSRFSGAIPPIVTAPIFAIRKRISRLVTLDEYVEQGVMTTIQRDILRQSIADKKNILVVGGTGSGKTTLTNALIAEMVDGDDATRFMIAEDTLEIQCAGKNLVSMRTTDNVSMTKLIKQMLRLRPDRIFIGEVRDGAALDVVDAWNTGHEGGIATLHANSAFKGLSRLRGLISRNDNAPLCIEEVIAESVHRIVYIERTPSMERKVQGILAVEDYSSETKRYTVRYLDNEVITQHGFVWFEQRAFLPSDKVAIVEAWMKEAEEQTALLQ